MFAELKACAYVARRTLQVEGAGKNRFVLLISTWLPSIGVTFITLIASMITQVAAYEILGGQTRFSLKDVYSSQDFCSVGCSSASLHAQSNRFCYKWQLVL